jgi:SAM-dependent methyltransferase
VKAFVELFARVFDPPGPVLEVGSLQTTGQEGYADLRPAFAGKPYVGCDLVPGAGVDRVESAEALGLADGSFGTVIAADSLEHVADPRRAVAEMHRVLAAGGVAVVATPFIFPIHHQPDYHRFTPEGMDRLLAAFPARRVYSAGDAQWPHTVYALAAKDDGAAHGSRCERLAAAWNDAGRYDPLLRFAPVTTVARRDGGDTRLQPLSAGGTVEHRFACPVPGLCRIDVKLEGCGVGRSDVALAVVDPSRGDVVARATARAAGAWRQRWVAFAFPPLAGPPGPLVFRLECADREARVAAHVAPDGTPSFEAFVARGPRA